MLLEGIRVLDFGRFVAGPYCAALLGDLGADVIRIERREGGEDRALYPVAEDRTGALLLQMNRNKRGMTLDPRKPGAQELRRRLVRSADVVVANLPPRSLAAIGLDYETLRGHKPEIILTTVNTFGSEGPWRDKLGFDGLAQAMSGVMHLTGTPDIPTRTFAPYVDYGTASLAAFATMAALLHRERTGCGQWIEGALLKTALSFMNPFTIEQDQLGIDREATLNRNPVSGPADTFATSDGWIMVLSIGAYQFKRWCEMVEALELLEDERFASDELRSRNGQALSARMAEWCATRTSAEALSAAERAGVPAGPVYSPRQVLRDEHVSALGFHQAIDYPGLDHPAAVAGFPLHMSATPGTIRHRAPRLGEHTDEILLELGYDRAAIADLRSSRAI